MFFPPKTKPGVRSARVNRVFLRVTLLTRNFFRCSASHHRCGGVSQPNEKFYKEYRLFHTAGVVSLNSSLKKIGNLRGLRQDCAIRRIFHLRLSVGSIVRLSTNEKKKILFCFDKLRFVTYD